MTLREKLLLPPWNIEALNPPFGDPGFFLYHSYSGQGLLFDLGDLHKLPPRKILQASHIFISHGHIDHLIGFDQMLRTTLNRPRHLHLYGPPGIIEMIGHKLQGYHWNLTAHYELLITVHAVHKHFMEKCTFACADKFHPQAPATCDRTDDIIFAAPTFVIKAVTLDHGTPCLAFTLNETLQVNFRPEELRRRHLEPGPWLSRLRQTLQSGTIDTTEIEVAGTAYRAGKLAEEIAITKPGLKIAYVTDIGFNPENLSRLLPLITKADLLLCEAAFLDSAADKAAGSHHLTATQAGELARLAQAGRLKLFHFSPRHHDLEKEFYLQARARFPGPVN